MSYLAAAQMGLSLASAGLDYVDAKNQWEDIQDRNRRAKMAGERANTITSVNVVRAHEQYVASASDISTAAMEARSKAIVNAAAAGTAGMSVDDSILDIERNASRAEANAAATLNDTVTSLELSREEIEAQVRNRTVRMAKPNLFAHLIRGAAGSAGSMSFGSAPKAKDPFLSSVQASRM